MSRGRWRTECSSFPAAELHRVAVVSGARFDGELLGVRVDENLDEFRIIQIDDGGLIESYNRLGDGHDKLACCLVDVNLFESL